MGGSGLPLQRKPGRAFRLGGDVGGGIAGIAITEGGGLTVAIVFKQVEGFDAGDGFGLHAEGIGAAGFQKGGVGAIDKRGVGRGGLVDRWLGEDGIVGVAAWGPTLPTTLTSYSVVKALLGEPVWRGVHCMTMFCGLKALSLVPFSGRLIRGGSR